MLNGMTVELVGLHAVRMRGGILDLVFDAVDLVAQAMGRTLAFRPVGRQNHIFAFIEIDETLSAGSPLGGVRGMIMPAAVDGTVLCGGFGREDVQSPIPSLSVVPKRKTHLERARNRPG